MRVGEIRFGPARVPSQESPEAAEIGEWNLEVVAAFMRAAYGKGYCDALTEDNPGSLCHDHGYRIPGRGLRSPARES